MKTLIRIGKLFLWGEFWILTLSFFWIVIPVYVAIKTVKFLCAAWSGLTVFLEESTAPNKNTAWIKQHTK